MQTYRIHLKIHKLSSSQSDDHLPLIHSTSDDGLLSWSLPFIHSLIRPDVTDPIRVHLQTRSKSTKHPDVIMEHFKKNWQNVC